ncbi:MAG: hypothetical protein K0S82_84 [Gaiellaceae bacterium]|jgi:hypothetical protein|nr:hypothetical protein [Gaiellaceae bacterium]
MALDDGNVTLSEISLELRGPLVASPPSGVSEAELESSVRTMARGGIEGAINAVNMVLPAGYELRFARTESAEWPVPADSVSVETVREELERG